MSCWALCCCTSACAACSGWPSAWPPAAWPGSPGRRGKRQIALLLAATFGGYGLLRKTAALGALEGLSFETLILFRWRAAYMLWLAWHGQSGFVNTDSSATRALLLASGPITAIPLLLLAAGARRLPLAVLGLLQYIAPTGQLLIGVWVFHESFTPERMLGFLVIWTALGLYVAEGLWDGPQGARQQLVLPRRPFPQRAALAGSGRFTVSRPSFVYHPRFLMANYVYTMNRVGKIVPPKRQILKDISPSPSSQARRSACWA